MSLKRKEIFEFGKFRLDVDEHAIERIDGMRNGTLTEKSFQALVLLVRRRGHLVTKDELIEYVWPDSIVEDNNLEKCVHHIRQFLGETSEGTRYIETVRKHGYRFVGRVNVVEVSGTWLPETFRIVAEPGNGRPPAADRLNANVDRSEKVAGIGVEPVKKTRFPLRTVLVILALICSVAGLGYYAFLRSGLGSNAAELLQAKRGTTNDEAYQLYQQAENLSSRRYEDSVRNALDSLNQAVTLDPDFARAWAAKAHVHRYIADYPGTDQTEQYKKSMDALGKAIAIDPNLSEAYSALCLNKLRYEYDVAGAETACKRALELDPDSSAGYRAYATFLYSRGSFDESIAAINRGMDLQPLSNELQQTYALALYYGRRYEEEEAQWKRLLELHPNHSFIYTRLLMNATQQGKEDKAFDYLIKKLTLDRADNETIERFRIAYAAAGWRGVTMERIKRPETESIAGPFEIACLYAGLGDKDRAFENLKKAYRERSYRLAVLRVEPQLDPIRGDPRYSDLIGRIEAR